MNASRYYVYHGWNQSDAREYHVAKVGDQTCTPLATFGHQGAAWDNARERERAERLEENRQAQQQADIVQRHELTELRAAVDRFLNARKVKGEHLRAYTALIVLSNKWNHPNGVERFCGCGDALVRGRCVNPNCAKYVKAEPATTDDTLLDRLQRSVEATRKVDA